jgi:hypothetical protein
LFWSKALRDPHKCAWSYEGSVCFSFSSWITYTDVSGVHCWRCAALKQPCWVVGSQLPQLILVGVFLAGRSSAQGSSGLDALRWPGLRRRVRSTESLKGSYPTRQMDVGWWASLQSVYVRWCSQSSYNCCTWRSNKEKCELSL